MSTEKYWSVEMSVFAFDTKEEAGAFIEKLTEAFMAIPEAANYGSATQIKEHEE